MNAAPMTETPDAMEQVRVAVAAAQSRKAEDLTVLNLAAISDFTDRFLICSGTNERQVQAIAEAILRGLRKQGVRPLHVEGLRHGRWVLLDYGGDMVVHVFLGETRELYALERLWSDAAIETERFRSE
jgi:ribosome-associated protein